MTASPLETPFIRQEVVNLLNKLSAREIVLTFFAGGETLRLKPDLAGCMFTQPGDKAFREHGEISTGVCVSFEGGVWDLDVSPPALDTVAPLPEGFFASALPEPLRPAALAVALEPLLEAAGAALGTTLRIAPDTVVQGSEPIAAPVHKDGDAHPSGETLVLPLLVFGEDDALAGSGWLHAPLTRPSVSLLMNIARRFAPRQANLDDAAVSLSLCAGSASFPLALLREVGQGDVLLFDGPSVLSGQVQILCGGKALWLATLADGVMTITGEAAASPSEVRRMDAGDAAAGERGEDVAVSTVAETVGMDDLEICLSIVLEERRVTLAELKNMGPGHTLVTGADPAAPVLLQVNGRTLGRGRLLNVDGRVGVMVTEFSGRPAERSDGDV